MEMYEKAYERYIEKCKTFGIHQIGMIEFIQSVTKEQAEMMLH